MAKIKARISAAALLAAMAIISAAAPGRAAVSPAQMREIEALAERAISEQIVFLNCSATDPDLHKIARGNWDELAAASIAHLRDAGADGTATANLAARLAYAAIMRFDAPFKSVVVLCQNDWPAKLREYRMVLLDREIAKVLKRP